MQPNIINQEDASNFASVFVSNDFCPASVPANCLTKGNTLHAAFTALSETILDADLSLANQERPLTSSNECTKKLGPNLKSFILQF